MIDPDKIGLIEMAFTALLVLGFGFWQLWSVRDAGKPKRDAPPKDESAESSGHPEG